MQSALAFYMLGCGQSDSSNPVPPSWRVSCGLGQSVMGRSRACLHMISGYLYVLTLATSWEAPESQRSRDTGWGHQPTQEWVDRGGKGGEPVVILNGEKE